jgi:hypothetical protein
MQRLTIGYCGLLILDGMLSVLDNLGHAGHNLSTWTTMLLCLLSPIVLLIGIVLSLTTAFRPRWPLLVASGFYSAAMAVIIASIIPKMFVGGIAAAAAVDGSRESWRLINLSGGILNVSIGSACLIGVLRRARTLVA